MSDEFWESAFVRNQLMWGEAPTRSALVARDDFAAHGVKSVLVPGAGYGRNAVPFLEAGMAVTGIEISETAIELARTKLGLGLPIFHGSVSAMPFEERRYDGIFCFGLLYLLEADERAKLLRDCATQLEPGGVMIFTVLSTTDPAYGEGVEVGPDHYETPHGVRIFFYCAESLERELGPYGTLDVTTIDEPMHAGKTRPFLHVRCQRPA